MTGLSRPPLNGLQPRTTREAGAHRYDWWEAPAPQPARVPLSDRIKGYALVLVVGTAGGALLVAFLTPGA